MVSRQSVGSRYTEPLFILLGLGAAGAAALAGYAAGQGQSRPELVAGAAAVFALFLLRAWLVARGRRWILPTEKGFILEDRCGTRSFTYEEISDLATASTVRYSGGGPKATIRRGTIVTRDCRVPFRYDFPLDRPDPLGFFFDRALGGLIDRAEAALAAGDTVRGDRWELTTAGLTVRAGRGGQHIAAEDLAATDLVAGHVCVWARGELHPSVRIPIGSTNARALLRLLDGRTKARGTDPDDAVGGLGRVLFERGRPANPLALLGVLLLLGGALAGFGAAFPGLGAVVPGVPGAVVGVGLFAVIGSPVFLIVILTSGNVFRCHTRGVFGRTCWRSRELRFEDVGRFSYAATRIIMNGCYAGTAVRLRFTPRAEAGGRGVTFSATVQNGDAELENLRKHVSRVVAAQLLRGLERGEFPGWTDGLRFRPDGLEWTTPGGLFSRRVTRLIPYDEIAGTDIRAGYFYLFLRSARKAVYKAPVSADNFFPGLVLLEMIRHRPPAGRRSFASRP